MLERLEALDKTLTLAINTAGTCDAFWIFMSKTKVWIPLYLAIIALLIWKLGWKKGLLMVLAIVIGCVASDQICNLVKDSVCRLRPSFDEDMIARGIKVISKSSAKHCYGFYSAHSSSSFMLAMGASLALGWGLRSEEKKTRHPRLLGVSFTVFMFVWAALVALSRVFLAKHFLGDIITGAFAGVILAYAVCTPMKWVCRRFVK